MVGCYHFLYIRFVWIDFSYVAYRKYNFGWIIGFRRRKKIHVNVIEFINQWHYS